MRVDRVDQIAKVATLEGRYSARVLLLEHLDDLKGPQLLLASDVLVELSPSVHVNKFVS